MAEITIRKARREDCKAIRDLIQELSEYEKMPEQMEINYKTLEKDGFDGQPLFFCNVATSGEKVIGYALFYYIYSTWVGKAMCLEDIYVTPEFRGKYVGDKLLKSVAKAAVESNCRQLDFIVLNWNPAQEFYKKRGACDLTVEEKWHRYRFSTDDLKKLAFDADSIDNLLKAITCEKVRGVAHRQINMYHVCLSEPYGSKSTSVDHELRRQIIDSDWGGYALDLNLWEDGNSPVTQVRPSEISLDNKECCGVLSDRLIGIGSSFLTRSPENGLYVLGKFIMRNKSLTDIAMLRYHRYLQYIDIAHNSVSSLSVLSNLPYLMYLDASNNKVECSLSFMPPWYLTYVNLSYNNMTDIGSLRNCWSIVRLDLSHNIIEKIYGLENLKHLRYLDLSYNLIECIENLDNLHIQELSLRCNCITSFKSAIPGRGINVLPDLQTILLAHNKLSTLQFFKDTYSLHLVDLKFNKINDLLEVLNLKGSIHEVDFRGNACTKWPNYRNVLISSIPSIKFIDGVEVLAAEKVTSFTLFASPLDLTAARNVAKLMLLEHLNIDKIHAHVQPYDEIAPPLVILTGPSAMKKMALALHVTRTIPDKVKYCRWHTTKETCENDDESDTYILVDREKFNDMARCGEFLVILDLLGHSYGFHEDQIVPLISEKKIGLTQMNLYATMEISKRYPNVKAILVLTQSVDLHRVWAQAKFDIYTWIKDSAENLLIVKIGKHVGDNDVETASCVLDFITEIMDEIIERLELPTYSIYIRPQGTGATTTDIILTSKTMLPKVIVGRREFLLGTKKRVVCQEKNNKEYIIKSFDQLLSEGQYAVGELKVLLDEEANIIIDDEETKRELHRTRMLQRRSTLELGATFIPDEEYDLNESNNDATKTEKLEVDDGKAKTLKNMYIELVMKSRQLYLDYHGSHPGFFSLVLFMDDYIRAFDSLIDFIQELCVNQSYRKSIFLSEMNHFTQIAIPAALESIVNEMRE
ncbi:leucine-rich repeat and guanylate kinase domain-containing protein [Odontomachus brunneus]|uniref:leucine-rich repeat and guanylate kinase domain-containing protein n=1 Tax=Odontomachus brunneus TaxID=486640 RepID=UPI0013F2783C|nr:leucine-rich repeat and guanylate kinase domain-containing protein [Odontomachus brunneus]